MMEGSDADLEGGQAGSNGAEGAVEENLEANLKAVAAEAETLRERLARARADYDNLQKRVSRDAAAERDRAKARVLEGLLPLFELCQMAARQAESHPMPKEAAGIKEGLALLAREFHRFLEREGLQATGIVGEPFEGKVHEAISEEAVEGIEPGFIARVIQPGYRLGEKVLRFAKVAVAPKQP